jgi:multicomponent Na+:H+ antiporter subunit C
MYFVSVSVFIIGLYMIITEDSYLRKIMGLGIFQTACIIFFLAVSKAASGVAPFYSPENSGEVIYTSSLAHVLMLTAIVVGFTTLAVSLALIYRIKHEFGSISERDINQ